MAACILAALGTEPEIESEYARAYAGALVMASAIDDLRTIKSLVKGALTKS